MKAMKALTKELKVSSNYEPQPPLVGFTLELRFRNGNTARVTLPKSAVVTSFGCTRQAGIAEVEPANDERRFEHDGTGTLVFNVAWKKRPASPKPRRSPPRAKKR
jgi:hypothetical protein